MTKSTIPSRFYSLDVLRGVAALSVVLWHWQFFFLPLNKDGVSFSKALQPMFKLLYIFYGNGPAAVQLFFCLSGFIFFWLYSQRISERTISFGNFSVLRFSRLYPLHFATLVLFAIGQFIYTKMTDTYFVAPFNDTYHFFLNVFFINAWGFEKGHSFNASSWSVSIEILLYLVFFLFCRVFNRNIIAIASAILVGCLFFPVNYNIAVGITNFFIGGLVFIAYKQLIDTGDKWNVTLLAPFVAFIVWIVTIAAAHPDSKVVFDRLPFSVHKITFAWTTLVLFPITIMTLALVETKRGALGKHLSFIGDISYSAYLIHFPLQLIVVIVTSALTINGNLYYSPLFMALFFFSLIILSFASHRYFEVPTQNYLRSKQLSWFAAAAQKGVA